MAIILYELCGRDPQQLFSPHCWKTRMALAHKGLSFESRPTPFTKIPEIEGGFSKTVPVLDDNGTLVRESFEIALYLERTYPDRPSLFGGPGGEAMTRFVERWTQFGLQGLLMRLIVADIHSVLDAEDQAYFRESRESRLGMTLEDAQAGREDRLEAFREALRPLREMLAFQPYIGGENPLFPDYVVFGALQWARVVSPVQLLADDDKVADWFKRLLDAYGGIGRATKAAA
jgi:glutathione S-transferase